MMRHTIFALIFGIFLLLPLQKASAEDVFDDICRETPSATLCRENKNQPHEDNAIYGPNGILTKVTRIISIIIGVAAIIAIIIGGFRYTLASGDPANVTKARNTIIYALVGLAVAAAAQGIVIFVLDRL